MPHTFWKLPFFRAARPFSACCLAAGFLSCIDNGTFIDPGDPGSHVPLGRYHGMAFSKVDSAITKERILGLESPKIALIWQFIGPKQSTFSNSGGVIEEANIPFRFRMELMNPPDKEILDAPDLALGMIWLYQDANGNGSLDRYIHPEMQAAIRVADSAYGAFLSALDNVLEVAETKPARIDVSETYYIGKYGTIVRKVDGRADTLWTATGPKDAEQGLWLTVLHTRFRILSLMTRWERFFALRKRDNEYFRIPRPADGYAMAFEFPYARKLFPMPGMEAEFERRVMTASRKRIESEALNESMKRNAVRRGWVDYPFEGFGKPGEDWVAGRTREYFILYIRNRAAMDEMLDAERGSSFSVSGKEKLHLGYNLIRCGDQYDCEVLSPADTIRIEYGMSEAFFNPPSLPLVYPIADPREAPVASEHLDRLEGAYRFQPFLPFCLLAEKDGLWISVPDIGVFRLVASDSLRFFAPALPLQLQIVQQGGRTEKLLVYHEDKRFVAAADSSLEIPSSFKSKVAALSARKPVSLPAEAIAGFSGAFDFAGDTLRVEASPLGDSLRIAVPDMTPHYYLAASESVFFSPHSDYRIVFHRDETGKPAYLTLERHDSLIWCPAFAHVPRISEELFPGIAEPDSQVSASEGGRRDTYVGLDGKGRYPLSSDGRFLGIGDGWVHALEHSLPEDSITLARGGEAVVFRLDGLSGRAGGLDVRLCRDPRAGKGRVRFRLKGGTEPSKADRTLAEDFWVDFRGDTATVSIQAWPVAGDPFFVRLERLSTADPAPPIAFDGYELRVSRGAVADP